MPSLTKIDRCGSIDVGLWAGGVFGGRIDIGWDIRIEIFPNQPWTSAKIFFFEGLAAIVGADLTEFEQGLALSRLVEGINEDPEHDEGGWIAVHRGRHLWPTLDRYGNQYLRYLHKLDIHQSIRSRPMHRAYPDAFVTACLLKFELSVMEELKPEIETIEQLIDWISNPFLLHRITFGKYGPKGTENPGPKGRLWSDVPTGYLEWLSEQWEKSLRKGEKVDADADTMFTVRHYLGL